MKNLLNKALAKCEQGEVYKREVEKINIEMKIGNIQQVNEKKNEEIALRLIKDGKIGSACAADIYDESVIDRAIISSRYKVPDPIIFPSEKPSEVKCYDSKVASLSVDELVEELERINSIISKYDPTIKSTISIGTKMEVNHILNSSGFDQSYMKTAYQYSLGTHAANGFLEIFEGFTSSNYNSFSENEIMNIVQMHQMSKKRVDISTGRMPVIVSGNTVGAFMMRLLSGIDGENILKGISPLRDKIGQKIFSDTITIRDTGVLDYGIGTCPFDDEGTPAQDTVIIENGVLKNYLAGISDSNKLRIKPTGNSFKSDVAAPPSIGASNIVIEGLKKTDEELIKSIDRGIFVDKVMGAHTGNIPAGEYSFNILCGYLIENGRITGRLTDSMVTGNIYEDFKKVVALGTKMQVLDGLFSYLGYSPAILFSELSVVGK